MRIVSALAFAVCLLASIALLSYGVVLALRVADGGPGHIGGDVVAACYFLAGLSLATVGALFLLPTYPKIIGVLKWAMLLALVAASVWFYLHLGGHIYSHESMFRDR